MKRIIIYSILIITFITLGIIGIKNKKVDLPDKSLLNKELYYFNSDTGEYETIKITSNNIEYKGNLMNFNNCSKYTYNSSTGIIKMDCNLAFRYISVIGNAFVFKINDKNIFFYQTKEESYNGEFQRTFNTTYDNYVQEGKNLINNIKLDYNSLINILNNEKIYIYIKSSNCNKVCDIYNNIYVNNNTLNNRYYLDLETLTNENITQLSTYNKPLSDLLSSNYEYPLIVELQNNNLINNIEVIVKGFNFENYINFNIESE